MPDLTDLNALLAQYGPLGVILAAAVLFARAYLAKRGGWLSVIAKSLFQSAPTRIEQYGLHAMNATSVITPVRGLLSRLDSVLGKVQANAVPTVILAPAPGVAAPLPAPVPPPAAVVILTPTVTPATP